MASSIAGKIAVGFTALVIGAGGGVYLSGALDDDESTGDSSGGSSVAAPGANLPATADAAPVLTSVEHAADDSQPDLCAGAGEVAYTTTGAFEHPDGEGGGETVYRDDSVLADATIDSAAGVWTATLCLVPGEEADYQIADADGNRSEVVRSAAP